MAAVQDRMIAVRLAIVKLKSTPDVLLRTDQVAAENQRRPSGMVCLEFKRGIVQRLRHAKQFVDECRAAIDAEGLSCREPQAPDRGEKRSAVARALGQVPRPSVCGLGLRRTEAAGRHHRRPEREL